MSIYSIIVLLLLLSTANITAQTLMTYGGARAEGLGFAISAAKDDYSLFQNPAGLREKVTTASFSFAQPLSYEGPWKKTALTNNPLFGGTLGFGLTFNGDDLYEENRAALAYAHRVGITSIAFRADLYQFTTVDQKTFFAPGISIGAITRLSTKLSIGACATNINRAITRGDDRLSLLMSAGIEYKPTPSATVALDVIKLIDYDPTVRAGFEYGFKQKVYIRTGFNLNPDVAYFGLGLKVWRLRVDQSLRHHIALGLGHQITCTIQLGKITSQAS